MKLGLASLALTALLLASSGCGHNPKTVAATVVDLAADACIEIAKLHQNAAVETICATADDVLPVVLDLIGHRAGSAPVTAAAPEIVCVARGAERLCVTRDELASRYDQIAARVSAPRSASRK